MTWPSARAARKKYDLIGLLDRNLIGDGICDMISGVVGGPAGTNYGENISTMAITKVFSVPVLVVAAVIAMIVSFFTPLIQVIYGIPLAVIGGLEVYLFGAIAAQGIAIMIENKVDMFSSKNIAVIASIMVIGIGGQYAFGGNIPFFGLQVPCIAGAAIFGIAAQPAAEHWREKGQGRERINTISEMNGEGLLWFTAAFSFSGGLPFFRGCGTMIFHCGIGRGSRGRGTETWSN